MNESTNPESLVVREEGRPGDDNIDGVAAKRRRTDDASAETKGVEEEKKMDDEEQQRKEETLPASATAEATTESIAPTTPAVGVCPTCQFPVMAKDVPFSQLAELHHTHQQQQEKPPLCDKCRDDFDTAATAFCQYRDTHLTDPLFATMFPPQLFQLGGVPHHFMTHFLQLKQLLTTTNARMREFGKIPCTGGSGKFQYMVGSKAASESQWDWQNCKLLKQAPTEATQALHDFAVGLVASLLPLGCQGYRIDPGFVMTQKPFVQGPHRDYPGYNELYHNNPETDGSIPNLDKIETRFLPWVLHLPLVEEGMELNYWPHDRKAEPPLRIHIPFGTYLMMRVDAVHGGILGNAGNIRLHIAYSPLAKAIEEKGKEWMMEQKQKNHNNQGDVLTDEIIKRHKGLGAMETGQQQRELDLLKSQLSDYHDPTGVDDCNCKYPITFKDDGYKQRLLAQNGWGPKMLDNVEVSTAKKNTATTAAAATAQIPEEAPNVQGTVAG